MRLKLWAEKVWANYSPPHSNRKLSPQIKEQHVIISEKCASAVFDLFLIKMSMKRRMMTMILEVLRLNQSPQIKVLHMTISEKCTSAIFDLITMSEKRGLMMILEVLRLNQSPITGLDITQLFFCWACNIKGNVKCNIKGSEKSVRNFFLSLLLLLITNFYHYHCY